MRTKPRASIPIETSSGLLTDMPPVLISLLVAVKRRLSDDTMAISVMIGMRI